MPQRKPVAPEKIKEFLDNLKLAAEFRSYRRRDFFVPYLKQQEFIDQGSVYKERFLSGGNQTGKSDCGAFEFSYHMTGDYPNGWLGKTFSHPVRAWACSTDTTSQRDVLQKKLCGEFERGTGMIPKDAIIDITVGHGTGGAYNQMRVRHKSGGVSIVTFKNYTQERENWQGDTLDFIWFDEEPRTMEQFTEARMRLKGDSMLYITATPLKGLGGVAKIFFEKRDPKIQAPVIYLTLDEVPHFSEEEKAYRISTMPEHEREARRLGKPFFGAGMVFSADESSIREDAIQYAPDHWTWLWGIDFGINHPFAAVLGAWDRDADVVHIMHTVRMKNARVMEHVRAMKPFGWIKVAWPQDGHQRDRGDLTPLSGLYKREGLRMLPDHAKFSDGSNSTEAGIAEMAARLNTGRLKVAKHLQDWFSEYRTYHRDAKTGLLVKSDDDLMSATRILIMALRHSSTRMQEPKPGAWGEQKMAIGYDDPPW